MWEGNFSIGFIDLIDVILNDAKLFTMKYASQKRRINEQNLKKADLNVQEKKNEKDMAINEYKHITHKLQRLQKKSKQSENDIKEIGKLEVDRMNKFNKVDTTA